MKRIIIMLLVVSSAVATITAQKKRSAKADAVEMQQNYPVSVRDHLNHIINKFGKTEGQVYSVSKNPNTGIVEMSQRISKFSCDEGNPSLKAVAVFFMQDEPYSYQIQHITPGSRQMFSIRVVSNGGQPNNTLHVRTNTTQEMWLMCAKNPDNPQLRDAYAIVWEPSADGLNVEGTVFIVSSLRPDLYTKNQDSSRNTFRIDGRVGDDLTDSLYVVYMADTKEDLDKLADDAFMEYMPVVNRRFSFRVEIDKPKAGRIRTVMPDGSLCHLWTNLDFVPGETYHITTHNGYYDEDLDYELRVGRFSGKSLVSPNTVRTGGIGEQEIADYVKDLPKKIGTVMTAQMELKANACESYIETINDLYHSILSEHDSYSILTLNSQFDQITKLNKALDAKIQDLLKTIQSVKLADDDRTLLYGHVYTTLLEFYTRQNKAYTEFFHFYPRLSRLPQSGQKAQKYVNKLTEKYMNEMSKVVLDAN